MMRVKSYELRVQKLLVIILTFITLNLALCTPAQATEATKAAVASPSTEASSIQAKLDALKKEIASKAASLKKDIDKKIQNKAIIGIITDNSATSITIATKKGERKITINEYTLFQDTTKNAKKTLTIKDIVKDDTVVVLGDIDDKDIFTAKKIIRIPKRDTSELKFVWGQIQTVNGGIINLLNKDNEKLSVVTTGNTLFELGQEESSIMDAKIRKFLVAQLIGKPGSETAKFVYFIPSVGFIKPEKKAASPSASVSPSPSKTPIKSASPSPTAKK